MKRLSPPRRAPALLVALGLAAAVTACASVAPAPFTEFASSLQPLRAGTDAQAGAAAAASRQDLIDKVAAKEVSPADLQLEFTDPFTATYGFAEDEPNYAKLVRFRQGLSALNDALLAYAQALAVLAGGGAGGDILPTTAQFDQMARDLNANAGAAATALGVQLDPGRQALLSVAAIELFKAYIESKRRKELAGAIAEVQPRVEEFSSAAQEAVRFLASLVETDYDKKVLPLATASPPDAAPILALNDVTQATLATLASLAKSYAAVPAAHRDLAAAAANRKTGLAGLVALGDEATRLQNLVTQLRTANAPAL
ncbi:MAG TPA: hypothetical protein VF121_01345 [Thermoanaerobaculia bacterium]|nr:hypothetical protein [Thermoanaerobaculia bacterium]